MSAVNNRFLLRQGQELQDSSGTVGNHRRSSSPARCAYFHLLLFFFCFAIPCSHNLQKASPKLDKHGTVHRKMNNEEGQKKGLTHHQRFFRDVLGVEENITPDRDNYRYHKQSQVSGAPNNKYNNYNSNSNNNYYEPYHYNNNNNNRNNFQNSNNDNNNKSSYNYIYNYTENYREDTFRYANSIKESSLQIQDPFVKRMTWFECEKNSLLEAARLKGLKATSNDNDHYIVCPTNAQPQNNTIYQNKYKENHSGYRESRYKYNVSSPSGKETETGTETGIGTGRETAPDLIQLQDHNIKRMAIFQRKTKSPLIEAAKLQALKKAKQASAESEKAALPLALPVRSSASAKESFKQGSEKIPVTKHKSNSIKEERLKDEKYQRKLASNRKTAKRAILRRDTYMHDLENQLEALEKEIRDLKTKAEAFEREEREYLDGK